MAAIALIGLSLSAQEPDISADRPGFADGPDTVAVRRVQIELGTTLEEDGGSLVSVPSLVRIGLTRSLEIRIASDVFQLASGDVDWAPVSAGIKLRLREGDVPVSLVASVQPPSGGGSLRTTGFEGESRLVASMEFGNGFSFVPNVGVSLAESEPVTVLLAASVEREMGSTVPFVDFELQHSGGEQSAIADAGIAWIVRPHTQLDLSGGFRVMGEGYGEWFVSAGLSRRFSR